MAFTKSSIVGSSGTTVDVGDSLRLAVDTKAAALIANLHGDCYSIVFEVDSGPATADFFYLKNLDSRDLVIYKIRSSTGAADIGVDILVDCTGTPTTPTALTPANMRAGGGSANVTAASRAGDMALTGGTKVETFYVDKDFVGEQEFDYPGGIILPEGRALLFNNDTDPTAAINTEVFFYFAD